jgi:hypothetical protein
MNEFRSVRVDDSAIRDLCRAIVEAHRADLEARLAIFLFDQREAIRRGAQWDKAAPIERLNLERVWK